MKILLWGWICVTALFSCGGNAGHAEIEQELRRCAEGVDAEVGVAVVTEEGEVFGINHGKLFPMFSVVKFPLAMAVADALRERAGSFSEAIPVGREQFHENTYSPMLRRYGVRDSCRIPLEELLRYSLVLSDNNACDMLMDFIGGPAVVNDYLDTLGFEDICVKWDENAMHEDLSRCDENVTTPAAMAFLLARFDRCFNDSLSLVIKRMMETSETGADRLPKPFSGTCAIVGHKTGTGDVDSRTGRILAVNDAGYVHLPDGKRYAIAVFVRNSACSLEETAAVIARISEIVRAGLCR